MMTTHSLTGQTSETNLLALRAKRFCIVARHTSKEHPVSWVKRAVVSGGIAGQSLEFE